MAEASTVQRQQPLCARSCGPARCSSRSVRRWTAAVVPRAAGRSSSPSAGSTGNTAMRPPESGVDGRRLLAVMHIPEARGPPQHLHPWLEAAARTASIEVVLPGHGRAERLYASVGTTHVL